MEKKAASFMGTNVFPDRAGLFRPLYTIHSQDIHKISGSSEFDLILSFQQDLLPVELGYPQKALPLLLLLDKK